MMRRIGASAVVAAALAATAASPASAAVWPVCSARLVPVAAVTPSCSFNSSTGWGTITVTPVVGTVNATIFCSNSGHPITKSRTFATHGSWTTTTPGGICSVTLSAVTTGAVANAVAMQAPGPIIDPGPAI